MPPTSISVTLDSSDPNMWYFFVGNFGYPITPAEFRQMMLGQNSQVGIEALHLIRNIALHCGISAVAVPSAANIANAIKGITFRV